MLKLLLFLISTVSVGIVHGMSSEPISETKVDTMRIEFNNAIANQRWDRAEALIKEAERAERTITARDWKKNLIEAKKNAQEPYIKQPSKPAYAQQSQSGKKAKLIQKLNEVNATTDVYKILGVSSSASDQEMKQAWENQKKQWGPDNNPEDTETARNIVRRINWAYSIWNIKQ